MSTHIKSAASISIMTVLSRITGLLRWSALGAALGLTVSHVADAYQLANILPYMVYELVLGGILTSVFIPIFVEYKTQKSEKEAWDVANRILTLACITLTSMTVLCWIFSREFVAVQTLIGNFPDSTPLLEKVKLTVVNIFSEQTELRRQATFFFNFFAPQIIFLGLSAIMGGMLNTYKKFTVPALVPILNNLVVITTAILYYFYPDQIGITGLAIGTTLGSAIMAFAQIPFLYKLGWRYRWILDFKDPVVKKFLALAAPMIVYVALNQVALTVRNNFATSIKGGLAAMQYGFVFFQLPYGIFSVAIMTVLYPTLSQHGVEKDWEKFRQTISQGIRWSSFIIIPCAIGYICLSEPIIKIVMERGNFHAQDTVLLSRVLAAYSIALLPYTLTLLFTRAFYALQDTRTPLIVVFTGVILTAIGCSLMVKRFGVPGIALAYGAQYIGMAIFFWILLRRKIKRFEGKRIVTSLVKSIIASTVMGVVIYFLIGFNPLGKWVHMYLRPFFADILNLSLTMAVGTLVYIAMAQQLRTEEFFAMKNWFLRRKIEL